MSAEPPRKAAGFTLLELLVALTLMGLLAGLLFGGLRFGTQVWAKGEQNLAEQEQIHAARGVVRRLLTRVIPYQPWLPEDDLDSPTPDDETAGFRQQPELLEAGVTAFTGGASHVDFVGPSPAQSFPGTLYWLRLYLDRTVETTRLMLAWHPVEPGQTPPRTYPREQTAVLLDDVAGGDLAYFGPMELRRETTWREAWDDPAELPRLVRLRVWFDADDGRTWPELVVAPMVRASPAQGLF